MAGERSRLLPHGAYSVMADSVDSRKGSGAGAEDAAKANPRKLNTFFGVMVPTILSMFSIILFLRTGQSAGDSLRCRDVTRRHGGVTIPLTMKLNKTYSALCLFR